MYTTNDEHPHLVLKISHVCPQYVQASKLNNQQGSLPLWPPHYHEQIFLVQCFLQIQSSDASSTAVRRFNFNWSRGGIKWEGVKVSDQSIAAQGWKVTHPDVRGGEKLNLQDVWGGGVWKVTHPDVREEVDAERVFDLLVLQLQQLLARHHPGVVHQDGHVAHLRSHPPRLALHLAVVPGRGQSRWCLLVWWWLLL